jgi:hypothetical protein
MGAFHSEVTQYLKNLHLYLLGKEDSIEATRRMNLVMETLRQAQGGIYNGIT